MSLPLFSIVIVSLNATDTIGVTLTSIFVQSCEDFEVVIKDGGSTDGTLNCIPQDKRIHVHCEADRSVYDAMNQAVTYANGKFLIFMNCGDAFATPDVLKQVRELIEQRKLTGDEVIYGNYCKDGTLFLQNPHADRRHFVKEGLCHQSVFFGRTLFEKYGNYDTDFRICADYEILTRYFINGSVYKYINLPICNYLGGGISEKQENLARVRIEGNMVRTRYFSCIERIHHWCGKVYRRLKNANRT